MNNLGTFEWLVFVGLALIVGFVAGRASKPGRPDDTFALPQETAASRREQRMQNLKAKATRKAAIKPELALTSIESMRIDDLIQARKRIEAIKAVKEATGASLKNAKNYIDAREAELEDN